MSEPFVLIDFMGAEVFPGDTVAISKRYGTAAKLFPGIITEIVPLNKSVRVYYKYVLYHSHSNAASDSQSYFILYPSNSGRPSDQFLKIDGVEFSVNQKRFAHLVVAKNDFRSELEDSKEK